jgi:hypothetical protein
MTSNEVDTGSPMKTILVQFAAARWMDEAVAQACVLARNSQARIVVLRLMHLPHPSYLRTDFGYVPATPQELFRLETYRRAAVTCGVELILEAMQSISSGDALVQAVAHFDADLLFAYVPPSWIPYWPRYQLWKLHEALGSKLVTLDQPIARRPNEALTIDSVTHPPLADSLPPVR